MTVKKRSGNYYEDFEEGDVYKHPYGRTVTKDDNIRFTHLTLNTNQLHYNDHYAQQTEFGQPLVNSAFTIALVTGMSVIDLSENAYANLGWDEVRLPNPLFVGDTVYAQSEVLSRRESESRPKVGIVTFHTQGYKEDGTVVIEYDRTIMVYKRDESPGRDVPGPEE